MPFQVMQYLPLTTLIASVILMSTMSYYSETSVLRSFGVGPWKMMFPLLIGGFFLISCSFILSEWVVPYSAERAHYITEVLIEKKQTTLTVKKDFWTKKNNELLNYQHYDPIHRKLTKVELIEVDDLFHLTKVIKASSAVQEPNSNQWLLNEVKVLDFKDRGNQLLETRLPQLSLSSLPINLNSIILGRKDVEEMALSQLHNLVESKKEHGLSSLKYRTMWHLKLSYHFAILLFSIIGIKFAFKFERNRSRISDLIFVAIIGFGYWFLISSGRALALSGGLDPTWTSWGANVLIIFFMIYQFITLDRKIKV
jgi:lipopolysaccharide export system permease protein